MKKIIILMMVFLGGLSSSINLSYAAEIRFNNLHTNSNEQGHIFEKDNFDKLKSSDIDYGANYKKYYSDGFNLFRQGRFYDAHLKFMEAKDSLELLGNRDNPFYAATIHSYATSYLWAIKFEDVKEDKDFMKSLIYLEEKAMDINKQLIKDFPENKRFLVDQLITSGQISFKMGDISLSRRYFLSAMAQDPQNKTASDYIEMLRSERTKKAEKNLSDNKVRDANYGDLSRIKMEVDKFIGELGVQDKILTRLEEKDLTVVNSDPLTFESGKADISPESYPFMDKIVLLLKRFPYDIRVEGHTDDLPIHNSRFSSNYELSFARANTFINYLTDKGIDPKRCIVAGYGESQPLYTDKKDKEKNRRIEIIFEKGETKNLASR